MKHILLIMLLVCSTQANLEIVAMENACDNNVGEACEELGYLYAHGEGVNKDSEKSKDYYAKACEYGFDKACKLLDNLENE